MTDQLPQDGQQPTEYMGFYEDGIVRLAARMNWPNGTPVCVRLADIRPPHTTRDLGKVIVAGFGLAGRWIADIFDRHGIEYVIVEQNAETVAVQRKLGRTVIQGNIADEDTLRRAGIDTASIIALTIPDEQAVIQATRIARALKPGIYIVARTTHSSAGMQAALYGADEVIKAEQLVARQFYEMLLRKIGLQPSPKPDRTPDPPA